MDTTSFDDLCQAVCDAVQQPRPQLPMSDDLRGFTLNINEMGVKLLHFPSARPDRVCVVVNFGVPPSPEHELAAMLAMMGANFGLMTQKHGAAYSRNSISGELLMQFAYPLADADAQELVNQITGMTRYSAGWHSQLTEQLASLALVLSQETTFAPAEFA